MIANPNMMELPNAVDKRKTRGKIVIGGMCRPCAVDPDYYSPCLAPIYRRFDTHVGTQSFPTSPALGGQRMNGVSEGPLRLV